MTEEYVAAENISAGLDGIDEMTAKLRELADAGAKMGDALTAGMDSMSREERFNAAMAMWRQFTKIGTAISWVDLSARNARRSVNTLLDVLPDCPEAGDDT